MPTQQLHGEAADLETKAADAERLAAEYEALALVARNHA